ncbi:hypothetical protein [Bacterioplanoides sp. SCSIO 12839]|uniref:hypothetical protein n=1 Tax=Bacterioplanoides sp. SCSIO 12839 TaxID=2829569 RepID=UPI0021044B03|nr:hypothetical protein [Bacterioplanoides sp. SCSIO 12839]UTW47295.1 hypothetical protein KFF03_11950 [Bacterioplanoides sp. SCSIO 12839]
MKQHSLPANKKYNPEQRRRGGEVISWIFTSVGILMAISALFNNAGQNFLAGLLAAIFFLVVFGGIGRFLKRRSSIKVDLQQELEQIRTQGIASDQRTNYKPYMLVAALFSVPGLLILFEGLLNWDFGGVVGSLFLLVGGGIFTYAYKKKKTYQIIGPSILIPDPLPPVIGHQLGGSFSLTAKPHDGLSFRLECVHTYTTQPGDAPTMHPHAGGTADSERQTYTVTLHQQEAEAVITDEGETTVSFRFELPDKLPETGSESYRGTIRWQVIAEGQVSVPNKVASGTQTHELTKFKRSWEIPVLSLAYAQALGIELTPNHVEAPEPPSESVRAELRQQANESVERQIDMVTRADGTTKIISEAGRNKSISTVAKWVGGVFGCLGLFLFSRIDENLSLWISAPVLTLLGWGAFVYGVFLSGRKLEAHIQDGHIQIVRSLFGLSLYLRKGQITSPSQLELVMTMSSTTNNVTTEYMAVYANVEGKKIKLAEGIEGRMAGEAMLNKIKGALTQTLNDELV